VARDVGRLPFWEEHYGSRLLEATPENQAYPSVKATNLEAVVKDSLGHIDLVKVDVQGDELSVLDGARPVIDEIDRWVIGTHGEAVHAATLAVLRELGYSIVFEDPAPPGQPDGLVVASRVDR
jgi:hypothetical protein